MTGESHRALREQLGAYALGQLSDEDRQTVHAHLRGCATCRSDLAEITPVADLLDGVRGRLDPEQVTDPDDEPGPRPLSPALIAEIHATTESEDAPVAARRLGLPGRSVLAAAAAAVIVAGGVGFGAGSISSGPASAPAGESVAVRAIDEQVQATARLVAHTWGLEVKLTATGFAPGQTYRVTVTDGSGRTVGAGEFIGTGGAEMRCNLNSSVLRDDATSFQVADSSGQLVLVATL